MQSERKTHITSFSQFSSMIDYQKDIVDKIRDGVAPENKYPYIEPDLSKWQIVRLAQARTAFVQETKQFAIQKINEAVGGRLPEEIRLVIYQEGIRRRNEPWRIDLPDEDSFWKRTRRKLMSSSSFNKTNAVSETEAQVKQADVQAKQADAEQILEAIVERYADEIAGDFDTNVFNLTRRITTNLFNRLMNAATSTASWYDIFRIRYQLQDRIKLLGEVDAIRNLAQKGTVILLPTHFSNLDSVLIGWAIDAIGLPAFSYGAGLNLFNYNGVGFFMNRLGAYKVDRRKKNLIYLETLKAYSQLSIQRGVHSLFFPGGTRERSGALESRLKLGLLGTALDAQQAHCLAGKDEKIFIVPLVLGYHFVLEAEGLIEEHLRRTGKELYMVERENKPTIWKTAKFIWKFFAESAEITMNFGQPIDVFGNFIDKEGNSIDKNNRIIDIKDYFISNGVVCADAQRDARYTELLSQAVITRFHKENIVLSSHVVAFTAFNTLRAKFPNLDLYGILRLLPHEAALDTGDFMRNIVSLQKALYDLERAGELKLSLEIGQDTKDLVAHGIKNLGVFHPEKPLLFDADYKHLQTENIKLLLYYHNKLTGYGLEKKVVW